MIRVAYQDQRELLQQSFELGPAQADLEKEHGAVQDG